MSRYRLKESRSAMRPSTPGRHAYSALPRRPVYDWPNGRRLAVYIGLDLERFARGEGPEAEPDAAWRLLELFRSLSLPASILLGTGIYAHCPELVAAFRDRGDEMVGRAPANRERQGTPTEDEGRALIAEVTAAMTRREGRVPAGWLGSRASESRVTPDLLKEAGYRYVLDRAMDDQPVWTATRAGPLLAVPYPQEPNDATAIGARRVIADAFADMIVDQFDGMRVQAAGAPLVMGIALHASLAGQPHGLRHLRRALAHIAAAAGDIWITRCGAIAAHVERLARGTLPQAPSWTGRAP